MDDELKECPSCPDGYVWTIEGPTSQACKTCGGYAVVKLNGALCDEAAAKTNRNHNRKAFI